MPIYSWPLRMYEPLSGLPRLLNVRESPFSIKLDNEKVRCTLCHRQCTLSNGQVGLCGMRFNINGKLYTATYGLLTAAESRPMEIKPLFHYYPRTSTLTISTCSYNGVGLVGISLALKSIVSIAEETMKIMMSNGNPSKSTGWQNPFSFPSFLNHD